MYHYSRSLEVTEKELCTTITPFYNRRRQAAIRGKDALWKDGIIAFDFEEHHFSECLFCIIIHSPCKCVYCYCTTLTLTCMLAVLNSTSWQGFIYDYVFGLLFCSNLILDSNLKIQFLFLIFFIYISDHVMCHVGLKICSSL